MIKISSTDIDVSMKMKHFLHGSFRLIEIYSRTAAERINRHQAIGKIIVVAHFFRWLGWKNVMSWIQIAKEMLPTSISQGHFEPICDSHYHIGHMDF